MGLFKVRQVFVVSDHSYKVACPLEIVLPLSKSMYYGEELLGEDVIVLFCSGKSFGEKGIGVQVSIKVCLHKDCPGGCEEGIGHDSEGFAGVREGQDWSLDKGCL